MFNDFLSLLFPECCYGCGEILAKGEESICLNCRYYLPVTDFHCNHDNELSRKFWGKLPVKYCLSYLKFNTGSKVQKLLHNLKYKGKKDIGVILGKWYGDILRKNNFDKEFDYILPVPLHKKKFTIRGYNQSDFFAEGLSASLSIPTKTDWLSREINNSTQTKKGRMERWENVDQIFQVSEKSSIINKRILVVDDVITTGSTLESCLSVLLNHGAGEISFAAIASA